jgi:triphosphoribosyl-dephospho-CoA synthase
VYAAFLSRYADSHVVRKYGDQHNSWISEQMSVVEQALTTYARSDLIDLLHKVDQDFKAKSINPGTTADTTVATILVVLLNDLLH